MARRRRWRHGCRSSAGKPLLGGTGRGRPPPITCSRAGSRGGGNEGRPTGCQDRGPLRTFPAACFACPPIHDSVKSSWYRLPRPDRRRLRAIRPHTPGRGGDGVRRPRPRLAREPLTPISTRTAPGPSAKMRREPGPPGPLPGAHMFLLNPKQAFPPLPRRPLPRAHREDRRVLRGQGKGPAPEGRPRPDLVRRLPRLLRAREALRHLPDARARSAARARAGTPGGTARSTRCWASTGCPTGTPGRSPSSASAPSG